MVLIKKGAEANLFLEEWHGRKVIMKRRLEKKYRLGELDAAIRFHRTLHEPQLIHRAKEAGVPTPTIFSVDITDANIIMEYIVGKQMKRVLEGLSNAERLQLCRHIGSMIGRLHRHGIIHGDLTTSNMILTSSRKVFFVDFGLGELSAELEAKGVDLHLMKRALHSTHYRFADECVKAVLEGYSATSGADVAKSVLEKIREIERRGRYVSKRGTKQ